MSRKLFLLSATVELPISRPPEEARRGRVGHLSTHCCTAHGSLVELFVERCPRRAPKLARCGRAGAPFRVAEACANEVVHGQPARCRLSHQLDERWLSPLAEGGKRRDGQEGQVRDVLLKQDRASSGCVQGCDKILAGLYAWVGYGNASDGTRTLALAPTLAPTLGASPYCSTGSPCCPASAPVVLQCRRSGDNCVILPVVQACKSHSE